MQQFECIGETLLARAPAKLNLSLLIAGKRPDGYHELETIMAKIDWYDEVLIERAGRAGIELVCRGPEWAPQDESNLVCRAARLLLGRTGRPADLRLTLTKNVPAGSGLGSASSDAATTLMGLNEYLGLGLPAAQLADLAAELGSDVTFFLNGPIAFCTGRGEKIRPLSQRFDFTALLITPPVSVSTKEIYENYAHEPDVYARLSRDIAAFLERNRIDLVARMCANMLRRTCFHLFEELGDIKEAVESLGAGPVCLSGSGSAMFLILADSDTRRIEVLRDEITAKTGCKSAVVRNNRW